MVRIVQITLSFYKLRRRKLAQDRPSHRKYRPLKQFPHGRNPDAQASSADAKKTRLVFFIRLPDEHPSVPYIFSFMFPASLIFPERIRRRISTGSSLCIMKYNPHSVTNSLCNSAHSVFHLRAVKTPRTLYRPEIRSKDYRISLLRAQNTGL